MMIEIVYSTVLGFERSCGQQNICDTCNVSVSETDIETGEMMISTLESGFAHVLDHARVMAERMLLAKCNPIRKSSRI